MFIPFDLQSFIRIFATVMDKVRYFVSWVTIVILSFWMTGYSWTHSDSLSDTATEKFVENKDFEHHEGTVKTVDFGHQDQPYAAIQESQSPFRLASQRPQRLIPVNGTGGSRSPFSALRQSHLSNLWKSTFRQALFSLMPMGYATPCEYYIIALRRIIR